MLNQRLGCLFLIFLLFLNLFSSIPPYILIPLNIFSIFFILPRVLKNFFYKISNKLFISYFLIGFVPIFASFILFLTIAEFGGISFLQNLYENSLNFWLKDLEKELLKIYYEEDLKVFFNLQKIYPGLSIKFQKDDKKFFFGCNENTIFYEKNSVSKGNYIFAKKFEKNIILNIPYEEILKKENFFPINLEWKVLSSRENESFFNKSKEKNLFKKPIIYSLYFLDEKNFLVMRTSIYSIYKGILSTQPFINKELILVLEIFTFILIALILISFIYSGFLVYKSSKSITLLSKGVNLFSEGKLDYKIEIKGKDELSMLGKNFNNMAESLKIYIQKLKEKAEEEKEIELASKIQKSLLPEEENFKFFKKYNLCFLPSKGIGGDYYDLLNLNGKKVIIIGDASGHGISSSLTMAMAKAIITSLIYRNTPSTRLLQEAHAILKKTGLENQFITLQIIEINEKEKTINFFNAGHPPAYLVKKNEVLELRLNSFPIGVFDGPGFDNISLKYNEGDILITYTDGLVEIDESFGIEELKKLIEENLKKRENIYEKISEKLNELLKDKNLRDDLTIIFLEL